MRSAPILAADSRERCKNGHWAYKFAVGSTFDLDRTHFAQLVKIYGKDEQGRALMVRTERLRDLPCKVIQLDEIWSFVGCREKNKKEAVMQHPGDVWTWRAICAETKLIPAWRVGDRSGRTAHDFCGDLSSRLTGEVQITSDGHPAYKMAVGNQFRFGADALRATRQNLRPRRGRQRRCGSHRAPADLLAGRISPL